jgi:SAM-dependent methyltransferase
MVDNHVGDRAEVWGEDEATHYDDPDDPMFSAAVLGPTVDVLAELTGGGRALELAIGTGRVALPLRERGVEVHGIELSEAMVAALRSKPGGDAIPVTIGDMATTRVDGDFRLVYLVYNTIENLLTQDAQVDCFRNAAAHLETGGHFLIEVEVPALRRLPIGQTLVPFDVSPTHIGIDEYDVATQHLVSHHTHIRDGVAEMSSGRFRYVWPAELDLMARIAGMALVDRWSGWDRAPFTSDSTTHVSVWRKP